MGNYKFRFSDMIPNAWFHKLRDMNKPRSSYSKTLIHTKKKHYSSSSPTSDFTKPPQPHASHQRKSYHFTRDLAAAQPQFNDETFVANSPRKSSSSTRRRRNSAKKNRPRLAPSTTTVCSCRAAVQSAGLGSPEECTNSGPDQSSSSDPDSVLTEYGSDDRRNLSPDSVVSWSSGPCECGAKNDIVIDITNDDGDHDRRRLPPIITKKNEKPAKTIQRTSTELSVKSVKERRVPAGMKLRVNSPRIANHRRIPRRSISDSYAVVKASKDPQRDFKESMVEMIVENNIRASKDLEELLACYLSLNSDEYHHLIINVFKQIWFEFIHLRLNN